MKCFLCEHNIPKRVYTQFIFGNKFIKISWCEECGHMKIEEIDNQDHNKRRLVVDMIPRGSNHENR